MKTTSIFLEILALCLISNSAFGQEKEVKSVKKEIRKEVRMEEVNGVNTLTISTDDNGEKTVEVFEGYEAEKKMAELVPGMEKTKSIDEMVEINVERQVNNKKVTIKRTSNGKETIEVYEGEAAELKLKELESETGTKFAGDEKRIVVKKVEVDASNKKQRTKKKVIIE